MFYGVLIRMFFRDTEKHFMPHIHADYQGRVGVYSVPDGFFSLVSCHRTSTNLL